MTALIGQKMHNAPVSPRNQIYGSHQTSVCSKRLEIRMARPLARLLSPIPISYSISRTVVFSRTWIAWSVTILPLLVLAILIPLNSALQGYQVSSTYSLDPNTTGSHWFNRFTPQSTPGSQCDPHILTVGDPFVTNVGGLQWTVSAGLTSQPKGPLLSNAGSTNALYSGQSLDFCDIQWMQISADSQNQRVEISAMMYCYSTNPFLLANTVVVAGFPNDAMFRLAAQQLNRGNTWVANFVLYAGNDLLTQMARLSNGSDTSVPNMLAITAYPTQCPRILFTGDASVIKTIQTTPSWNTTNWCSPDDTSSVPELGMDWELSVSFPTANATYQALINNSVNNVFQTMLAAGRLDLGNVLPNNLFYQTQRIVNTTNTLLPPFEGGSAEAASNASVPWQLASQLHSDRFWGNNPIPDIPSHPEITISYLCHLTVAKNLGSAVVSVLVATLSIGSSAWALLVFVSAKLYAWNHREHANYCEYHAASVQRQPDIEAPTLDKTQIVTPSSEDFLLRRLATPATASSQAFFPSRAYA